MTLFDKYQPSPGDPVYRRGKKIGEIRYVDQEKGVIAFEILQLGPPPTNAYHIKEFEKMGYTLEPTENPGQPLRNHYNAKTKGYDR